MLQICQEICRNISDIQNLFKFTKNFTLKLQLAHPQVALHLHTMFFVVVFCVVSQAATSTQTTAATQTTTAAAAVALKVRVGNFLRSAALRSHCQRQRRCRRRSQRIFTFISSSSTTRPAVDVVVVAVSLLLLLLLSFLWRGRCKLDILNLICTFKTFAILCGAGGGYKQRGKMHPRG